MADKPLLFTPKSDHDFTLDGSFRLLEKDGRIGWHATSIHSRLRLPVNTNDFPVGTVTLWMLPMDEFSYRYNCADPRGAHPGTDANNHILIGDHPDPENVRDSHFALIWDCGWYPQYWAKFFQGHLYHAGFKPKSRLLAAAGHASFERLRWVQVALSWDKPAGKCAIYHNGVLISESPSEAELLTTDPAGPELYTGSPAFAVGEVALHPRMLSHEELQQVYEKEATNADPAYQQKLLDMYNGENTPDFSFSPDASWEEKLTLSLTETDHLAQFYVQGKEDAPSITPEGLLIETATELPPLGEHKVDDKVQVYLWSEQSFEGDLYLTYEYMPLQPGGLSLLLTQASGLKGEDFMADYPRRTTGSMSMVCWENVRNYHWEYYREVSDVPPNSATSGLIKNPRITPYAYRRSPEPTAKNTWHRLEFLQEGERIRGALDGQLMFDVQDSGTNGSGPVYRHGRFSIRCMLRTKMLFRNLQVYNRAPDFKVVG